MSLVSTRMSVVYHWYVLLYYLHVLVCYPDVTRMYSYVIVCHLNLLVYNEWCVTRMLSVCLSYVTGIYSYVMACHSYVLVCYLCVNRMSSVFHSYVVLPWTSYLRNSFQLFVIKHRIRITREKPKGIELTFT